MTPSPKTRLLIVDDEETFASSVRRYLSSHEFDCTIASSGQDALTLLQATAFDVLMVDIRMPKMDGFEVCRRIREKSTAPLIMCSGAATDSERTFALEIGADDCLVKPIEPRELLARIRALLRRTRSTFQVQEHLELGSLVIDRPSRTVTVHGEPRFLTQHEFELLWVLARANGRVLGREEILDALQGAEAAFDRSVDVHISKIRQKLGEENGQKFIRTVRGVGYALTVGSGSARSLTPADDTVPPLGGGDPGDSK